MMEETYLLLMEKIVELTEKNGETDAAALVLYGLKNCRINLIRSFFMQKSYCFPVNNFIHRIRSYRDSRCFFYIVVIC